MTKWLKRICSYWNDKKLAEQCGMEVKDICAHESDYQRQLHDGLGIGFKCKKCGEFYK